MWWYHFLFHNTQADNLNEEQIAGEFWIKQVSDSKNSNDISKTFIIMLVLQLT